MIGLFRSYAVALRLIPWDTDDNKSTLVQVMAWCRKQQAITWANGVSVLYHNLASLGQIINAYAPWLTVRTGRAKFDLEHLIMSKLDNYVPSLALFLA